MGILMTLAMANMSMAQTPLADHVNVASVQFQIKANQSVDEFLNKVEQLIKEAVAQKADVVLLPELITLDTWSLKDKVSDKDIVIQVADKLTPIYEQRLKQWAQQYQIMIVGGSTLKRKTKIFNTAFVVYPGGKIIEHDKVYLTKWELENGISAGQHATVFDTKWGKMAILICFDVEFPDLSVELSKAEIDVILVPSMTESPQGLNRVRWTAQARAIEHTAYVVVSTTVGNTAKDWQHFGVATFISPQIPGMSGILSEGKPDKSGVWTQRLDLKKLRDYQKSSSWRPAKQIRVR